MRVIARLRAVARYGQWLACETLLEEFPYDERIRTLGVEFGSVHIEITQRYRGKSVYIAPEAAGKFAHVFLKAVGALGPRGHIFGKRQCILVTVRRARRCIDKALHTPLFRGAQN